MEINRIMDILLQQGYQDRLEKLDRLGIRYNRGDCLEVLVSLAKEQDINHPGYQAVELVQDIQASKLSVTPQGRTRRPVVCIPTHKAQGKQQHLHNIQQAVVHQDMVQHLHLIQQWVVDLQAIHRQVVVTNNNFTAPVVTIAWGGHIQIIIITKHHRLIPVMEDLQEHTTLKAMDPKCLVTLVTPTEEVVSEA